MTSLPQLELSAERQFRLSSWLRSELEDIQTQAIEARHGPEEMSVMAIVPDLVYCKEAWPHIDPKWGGSVFFTMTADGDMYQFGTVANPDGERVPAGKVFRVHPLELHWLRPDPVVSTCWLGLQWVVPRELAELFARELAGAINRWNAPEFVLPQLGDELEN